MDDPFQHRELLTANEPHKSPVAGLAAGTLVTTPEGDKTIEAVKAGDLVLSGVGDGFSRYYEVTEASSKPYHGPLLRIECQADEENEFRKFEFRATPKLICFAHSSGDTYIEGSVVISAFDFYDIKTLQNEHIIHFESGKVSEKSIDRAEEFALQIAHSQGGAEVRSFFGFINEDMDDAGYRFMPASELKIGMLVLTAKEFTLRYTFIKSITQEHYDGLVYALDVPEARNFASHGVLVHDSTLAQPSG